MSYYVYSVESLPYRQQPTDPYIPGRQEEFIIVDGFVIGPIVGGQWFKLQPEYKRMVYDSFMDQGGFGRTVRKIDHEIAEEINSRYSHRGVRCVSEMERSSPYAVEIEKACKQANLEHRRAAIEAYEVQLAEKKSTGMGRMTPTPYEMECYEVLGIPKPYSMEAFRAERLPGEEAAERISHAIKTTIESALMDNRLKQKDHFSKEPASK